MQLRLFCGLRIAISNWLLPFGGRKAQGMAVAPDPGWSEWQLGYQDRNRVLFRRRKPDGFLERMRWGMATFREQRRMRLVERSGTAGREVPAE